MGPPIKDDISREKMILMTSLRTHRASAVSSPGYAVLVEKVGHFLEKVGLFWKMPGFFPVGQVLVV